MITRILAMFNAALLSLLLCASNASAQGLEIDIVDGTAAALPITIVPFGERQSGPRPATDIAAVIRADLARAGQFRVLGERDIIETPERGGDINYSTWRLLKQDFIVVGRLLDSTGGGYRVEYELYDIARQSRLIGQALVARDDSMRDVAHQIADAIYEKILGVPGAFWTRVAYVTSTGVGRDTNYALMIADSDGFNPQPVVRSKEPLLSPAWSPDGRRLAYVSFERGSSSVYMQDLTTGQRDVVSSHRGINGAPAFSPDGQRLALTLSKSGNPEIYLMDIASRRLTQLTNHWGIDTEPAFVDGGSAVVFTSDRGGKPQLYKVSTAGGEATRVTFDGEYNARATVCCQGKKIAMARGRGNVYRIALLDRSAGGQGRTTLLSPGPMDESPSFAPNGSMVLYAAREGRRGVLYAVSADARVRQRLVLSDGDVREPAWSPHRQR